MDAPEWISDGELEESARQRRNMLLIPPAPPVGEVLTPKALVRVQTIMRDE